MYYLKTIFFTLKLFPILIFQYFYAKLIIKPYLWQGVSSRHKTKILVYATFIPILFPYGLAKLSKSGLTKNKKEIVTLISAMMPVNDESIDKYAQSPTLLKNIFNNPSKSDNSDTLMYFQAKVLMRIYNLNDSIRLKTAFNNILTALSKKRQQILIG